MQDERNGAGHGHRTRESSSDESIRPAKRKATVIDDEDYIRQNADLFGLRRSHRARQTRPLVESSDEGESDSDIARPPRKRIRQTSYRSSKQHSPVVELPSDSGSDAYGGRRGKLTKKQKRRFLESGSNLAPSHAELRFSTRRAGKVSNYNEDEDDEIFDEDDSEMLTPNNYAAEPDNTPAIDQVLNHRLRADITTPSYSREDYEFLIKWQDKSHYHASWNTAEELTSVRSLRRLDNYIKKNVANEVYMLTNPEVAPEDKEKFLIDREQHIDALSDYNKVERIISDRDEGQGTEYLVKWKSLFYN